MSERIQLSTLVDKIRQELYAAHQHALSEGGGIMQFEECELEFAVETEVEAKGGIKVYILSLSGGGKRSESNIVRIKYKRIEDQPIVAPTISEAVGGPKLRRQRG
jgi:hypothetical protein